ncbi:RICIN domain-containing protein [Streptomyces sp. NPDC051907]|uniref:RICIN domain-containing protein n=1 Tax=Streptomyces sp. NPDC051907 TaxID=3155284 RepID=UPI00343832A0
MARIVRAALAVGASLAALVGSAATAHAADNAAADKTYIQFETANGSLCLGAGPNNAVYLDGCGTGWMLPALWEAVPQFGSAFELRWAGNDNCLEVAGGDAGRGAKTQLGACSGSNQTRWQLDLVDPVRMLYQLRPTHAEDRCLDIPSSDVVQSKPLQSWSCNQTDAQLWRVKQIQWPSA